MWLGLRIAGLFLGCCLLLCVHVGVLVDGLLVFHYNLITRWGRSPSCLYISRKLSGTDKNSNHHKRELVSIMAKKRERIEDNTDGNSVNNKGFPPTGEKPAREIIGEEKQVKERDPSTMLRVKLGEGIQMREVNETINDLLAAAQGPYSHTRSLVDSYTSSDGKFYEVFQDVHGEYIVGPVLRDPKWDVHPFNDPSLLAHIYKGVKEEFFKNEGRIAQEVERNDVGREGNEAMDLDDDDERFDAII